MKKLILCVALSSALLSVSSQAAMTPRTAAKVQEAYELYEQNKVQAAIEILAPMELSDTESKAHVARLLGSLYWSAEQPKNALTQLNFALNSGVLNEVTAAETRRMIADLHLTLEQYQSALTHYNWLRDNGPASIKTADLYLRIAQSNYQLSRWQAVITAAKQATSLKRSIAAYQMQLNAHQQLKQWKSALTVTQALIDLEPRNLSWWRQRVSVQLQLKNQEGALTTLALAKHQGLLETAGDYRSLIQLFANRNLPELAARLLSEQLGKKIEDNKTTRIELARYWQAAREWQQAAKAWGHVAALDKQYYLNQFEVLVTASDLTNALKLLPKLDSAKFSDKQQLQVEMMAVRAFYQLERYAEALERAQKAKHYDLKMAEPWITFLQQKLLP